VRHIFELADKEETGALKCETRAKDLGKIPRSRFDVLCRSRQLRRR